MPIRRIRDQGEARKPIRNRSRKNTEVGQSGLDSPQENKSELTRINERFLHLFNTEPKFRRLLIANPTGALRKAIPELKDVPDEEIKAAISKANLALAEKYNVPFSQLRESRFGLSQESQKNSAMAKEYKKLQEEQRQQERSISMPEKQWVKEQRAQGHRITRPEKPRKNGQQLETAHVMDNTMAERATFTAAERATLEKGLNRPAPFVE
jgi:hypothetical protein